MRDDRIKLGAERLKNIIDAVAIIRMPLDLNFMPGGLMARHFSSDEIAMVDLFVSETNFEEYEVSKPVTLSVTERFMRVFKKTKPLDTATISVDREGVMLNIKKEGYKFTYRPSPSILTLFNFVRWLKPLPKIVPKVRLSFLSSRLKKELENFEEVVTIDSCGQEARFYTNDYCQAFFELGDGNLLDMEIVEPSKATYNCIYLYNMVNSGSKLSEDVMIEYSTNNPMRISFSLKNEPGLEHGKLDYYLSPYIMKQT